MIIETRWKLEKGNDEFGGCKIEVRDGKVRNGNRLA